MIRDPSDGSIKEPAKPMLSGLPEMRKDGDEKARLEQSRAWLKEHLYGTPAVEK
jgi:hypothetical protein